MNCSNCGLEIQIGWKVCPSCKSSLEKEKCSTCDRELEIDWEICPFCPQPKNIIEEESIECLKVKIHGINYAGTYDPYDFGKMEGGRVEGFLSVENVNDTIDQLVSLHPFSVNEDCLLFTIYPKSGEGELSMSFDNKKILVEEYTDSMHSVK